MNRDQINENLIKVLRRMGVTKIEFNKDGTIKLVEFNPVIPQQPWINPPLPPLIDPRIEPIREPVSPSIMMYGSPPTKGPPYY